MAMDEAKSSSGEQTAGFWRRRRGVLACCAAIAAVSFATPFIKALRASTPVAQPMVDQRYDQALNEILQGPLAASRARDSEQLARQQADEDAFIASVRQEVGELSNAPASPVAPFAPPPGFTKVVLQGGTIRFDAPTGWRRVDPSQFERAQHQAAIVTGRPVGSAQSVFQIADRPVDGAPASATINVLVQRAPTATQDQLRQLRLQNDPAFSSLQGMLAAEFVRTMPPAWQMKVVGTDWADNGKLLCLHIHTQSVVAEQAKTTETWKCSNSSATVTLIASYPAADAVFYRPVVQKAFDSLDLVIDSTVRVR